MCGIVGGISFGGDFFPSYEELSEASEIMRYRGPDDKGDLLVETESAKLALAHRRLSIIDLSKTGHQPMESTSKRSAIVFNGEIYNYQHLRQELLSTGYVFGTRSDTEVILGGYERWGIEGVIERLDGMFAFALFDKEINCLYLVRDRFGKKPLYFFADKNRLAFSSDIRVFSKLAGVHLTLNQHALGYFFAELSTPEEDSIWREVKKVLPGNYIRFDRCGLSPSQSYWQLSYTENCKLDREEIVNGVDSLLTTAVRKRLVADVNVSALLSGGIDSSLIVAKMAELSSKPVKTYSIGFIEDEFNELPYARQVASQFGTEHTEVVLTEKHLDSINDLIVEYGEPFADSSMIPTYLMSREISKSEKVALGGDGGDELFGGYYAHYFANKYDLVKRFRVLYPMVKPFVNSSTSYRLKLLERLMQQTELSSHTLLNRNLGFSDLELKRLCKGEQFCSALSNEHQQVWSRYTPASVRDLINIMSASVHTRLVNDYLVKIDRASMYASLEIRSPFLDKDLAEFASTLTADQLMNNKGTKSILKEVAERYYSKSFIQRRKKGFEIPLRDWFRVELAQTLREVVLGSKQTKINLDYHYIEQLIDDHLAGTSDHTHKLWSLYVFHVWVGQQ